MRTSLGFLLAFAFTAALCIMGFPAPVAAETSDISVSWLTGDLYLVEDPNFVSTNSLVYIGKSSVTVVGATWTPGTARELATRIRALTALPVREVIDISPDPEWSGGNAYWKNIGAEVVAAQVTCDALVRIPMAGNIASLNVSVAAGIALFGWRSRRERKN